MNSSLVLSGSPCRVDARYKHGRPQSTPVCISRGTETCVSSSKSWPVHQALNKASGAALRNGKLKGPYLKEAPVSESHTLQYRESLRQRARQDLHSTSQHALILFAASSAEDWGFAGSMAALLWR